MTEVIPEVSKLSGDQKGYLKEIINLVEKEKDPEKLQFLLYNKAKEKGIKTKEAFAAIYTAFLGKDHGPKAAWFLLSYPKESVVKRLMEAAK